MDSKNLKTESISKEMIISRHRCPPCPQQLPFFWRSFRFANKALFAGSLIYYTYRHGAWGTPEESRNFINKMTQHLHKLVPYHIAAFIWDDE